MRVKIVLEGKGFRRILAKWMDIWDAGVFLEGLANADDSLFKDGTRIYIMADEEAQNDE